MEGGSGELEGDPKDDALDSNLLLLYSPSRWIANEEILSSLIAQFAVDRRPLECCEQEAVDSLANNRAPD